LFSADPLKLCPVGRCIAAQLFSGLSRDVRSGSSLDSGWDIQGHSRTFKDIQRLVLKPLLLCLGCVLRFVVLLEGEPPPQSEVLIMFLSRISVLCSVQLCLDPD
jgi:hypothetical protein